METNLRATQSSANGLGLLGLCERASQTELTEELEHLTELLKLPLGCYLAVHQVLSEGNWRKAKHPRTYIRKAALTQARKLHLAVPHRDDTLECEGVGGPLVFMDGAEIDKRWDGSELTRVGEDVDGPRPKPITPLKGKHYVKAQFAPDDEVLDREIAATESGPFWPDDCYTSQTFFAKNPDGSIERWIEHDWRKLGHKAGLDPWEARVLEYRACGISREQAMEQQRSDVSRKAIQAAWKRFERTGKKKKSGMERVQLFLRKSVPDEPSLDTRDIEASASPHPKAVIPGNPLQAAWKQTGGKSREDLGRFLIKYRGREPQQVASCVVAWTELDIRSKRPGDRPAWEQDSMSSRREGSD